MKIKLLEIVKARQALERLSAVKLKPATALKIMRNIRLITPEIESYDKLVNDTITAYDYQFDGHYKVPTEFIPRFVTEMNATLEEEIELDIVPIPFSLITSEISSEDLHLLAWLFDLEEA